MPFYIPPSPNIQFYMYNLMMNPFGYTQFPQSSDHVLRTFDMIHPYGHYTNQAASFDVWKRRQACCNTFNTIETEMDNREVTLYSDNVPFTFQHYEKSKTNIFDLDRLIFPEDPIRDWVEKKVSEINAKYAWAEKIYA